MQTHSIISSSISEENLQTGHLSIRFMMDGFSLLLADKNYTPILLNRFHTEQSDTKKSIVTECMNWLARQTLINGFTGEVTIITDSIAATLIPKTLFLSEEAGLYLENSARVLPGDVILFKHIKNRPFVIVHSASDIIHSLSQKFSGVVRITAVSEVLFSIADQVNASDHQRGFAFVEVQSASMSILYIENDQPRIVNQYRLKNQGELVFHLLNTLEQLGFNREQQPLFYSGIPIDNELMILGKYIRNIKPLTYFIKNLNKSAISEHSILAEATKCE